MTYNGLKTAYLWCIKALLFVVPFLPLYVSSSMLFPYITGRNFTFRILVEIAFICWIGLAALAAEYRPRLTKLNGAIAVFLGIVFLADLMGVHAGRSFWSNYERMEGFWTILHVVMYYFVLAHVFKAKRDWMIFFNLMLAGGFLVGAYGFFQKLGYLVSLQGGSRVDGTIGNPAYLAAYLMLVTVFAGIAALSVRTKQLQWLYGALAGYFLMIIYFSATRGAAIALFVAGILFGLLYIVGVRAVSGREKLFKKLVIAGFALLIAAPIAFYQIKDLQWVRSDPVLGRFANLSLEEKTTRSRFMIWGIAWQGVAERPVLGWGQENFNIVFARYFNPQLFDQEPWFDRSHDIFFDWLIHAGILGLISYLSIFGSSLYLLWRRWRQDPARPYESLIIGVGLIAYFLQNIFVFDNLNTYILFFAILAYVNGFEPVPQVMGQGGGGAPEKRSKTERLEAYALQSRLIPRSLSIVVGAAVFFAVFTYVVNLKAIYQSRQLIESLRLQATNATLAQVRDSFQKALAYNSPTGTSEVREQLAQSAQRYFDNTKEKEEDRNAYALSALAEMEKQVQAQPLDVKYRQFIASMYLTFARISPEYIAKAESALLEAIRMSPSKQQTYYALAQLYMNTNRMDKAVETAQSVVDLEPVNAEAQTILAVLSIVVGKGDIDRILADFETAADASDAANRYRLNSYPRIIAAFERTKNYPKIAVYYEKLIKLNPENAQYHASLAATLYMLENKEGAKKEVLEAIRLDPANYKQQGEQFLQLIESGAPIPGRE